MIQSWPNRVRRDDWSCDFVDGRILQESALLREDPRNTLWYVDLPLIELPEGESRDRHDEYLVIIKLDIFRMLSFDEMGMNSAVNKSNGKVGFISAVCATLPPEVRSKQQFRVQLGAFPSKVAKKLGNEFEVFSKANKIGWQVLVEHLVEQMKSFPNGVPTWDSHKQVIFLLSLT